MSKKELADALCQALFGDDGKYISNDNDTAGFCDRLGYFQGTGEEYDEPMQVIAYDRELTILWMNNDVGDMNADEFHGFVKGIIHAVDPRWTEDEIDSHYIHFVPQS